jgi:hypothetical protein
LSLRVVHRGRSDVATRQLVDSDGRTFCPACGLLLLQLWKDSYGTGFLFPSGEGTSKIPIHFQEAPYKDFFSLAGTGNYRSHVISLRQGGGAASGGLRAGLAGGDATAGPLRITRGDQLGLLRAPLEALASCGEQSLGVSVSEDGLSLWLALQSTSSQPTVVQVAVSAVVEHAEMKEVLRGALQAPSITKVRVSL